MHLERIEMSGFKSFADKTIIEFDKGVTAVVGPNGSGKSNLSEAIKWVLGEQSAKSLRGKKMDDIIFAGSQTRKPTNIAEVTLVLNNEDHFLPLDYPEIQITRRFHRNGDSECFINKKPCRLKDIVHLFMDSGLGKDSFSIISQGKVETIFHNKPEERRSMFEEVAGVLKYKTKKHEASRKLVQTQENLDRVEDILHEINGQLTPLEKQKEKALLYQEKKQALSQVDVALMVVEVDTLTQQWHVAKEELKQLQQAIATKEHVIDEVEKASVALREKSGVIEQRVNEWQNKYVALVQKVEQLTGQENVLNERLLFSKKDIGQQDAAKYEKTVSIQSLEQQLQQLTAQQQEKEALLNETQLSLKKIKKEEKLLSEGNTQQLEAIRQTYIEQLQEQTRFKNDVLYLQKEIKTLTHRLEEKERTVEETASQQMIQKKELQDAQNQLDEIVQYIDQLTADYQQKATLVKQLQAAVYQEVQQVDKDAMQLHQQEARRNSLQDLSDDYAGFYQGVREILKQKQTISGIRGAIAELIQVPKEYTTAIDIALGASMQHVVVDDEQVAKQAIHYLKQKRLGRATFLPLRVMKGKRLPQDILKHVQQLVGFIGVASELVNKNSEYTDVVDYFLGQTLIADTLDNGTEMAKKINYRYKIVSLDGEVIHAGGSMTGGATQKGKNQSLLSRQQELDDLQKSIFKLKDTINESNQRIANQKERLTQEQEALDLLQQEGTRQRLLEKETQGLIERLTLQHSQKQLAISQDQKEKEQLESDLTQLKEDLAQAEQTVQHIQQSIDSAKLTMDKLNVSEDDRASQLQFLQNNIQKVSNQVAVLEEQVIQLNQQIQSVQKNWQQEKLSLEAMTTEYMESTQTNETLAKELECLKPLIQQIQTEKIEAQQELDQCKAAKQEVDNHLLQKEQEKKQLQQQLQQFLKQSGTLEGKISRLDVSIDTHLTRLNEEYQLTYEAAKQLDSLTMSVQEAGQYVAKLKREIEQLGPVNMAAIEEYAAVFERMTFMREQQADLLSAKNQLMQTMTEMDEEMTRRFSDTFYAIKSRFEQTFPKLFGGGRATLELSDPTNLLETGIDIIAQPPGKRLQNLSLLSGGEKAFTAIALLFAILEVKPVPFCLLDEVEAALDEANVGRYGRYLNEFIDDTQFIVITHRKGTMESANVLYGVTMQESGVSKLASVRFEDYMDK